MNWSKRLRQLHRWMSITFTVAVIASFIAVAQEDPITWVYYTPLPPLFLLLGTGLYMFALPYVARRRSGQQRVAGG